MSDIEKRFPFDAYPKGWFQVAYGREVDSGQVIGLRYFGRYAKAVNRTARLRWPTVERAGAISVWRAEASAEPEWELPRIPDRPQLARGEGAITEFRAWARQSYEEAYA